MQHVKKYTLGTLACIASGLLIGFSPAQAQTPDKLLNDADRLARSIEAQVLSWRRDIHQHPELGNREFRTSKLIADYLSQLGMEVHTGIAHTGVVGILRGNQAGPVVALRAEMDALPVTEQVDLPFASKDRTTYNDNEVGVMHACGHDTHMAMLMGVAQILTQVRDRLPGTVKFIFQPAEEGAPRGEEGGAKLMVKEGVLENPSPSAIFGLHVFASDSSGLLMYKSGGIMASSDALHITVRGRQTHGAVPWGGVDPIVVAAQIVLGLQTIVSRQIDLTSSPAVVTIGSIQGGVRGNIIPDEVVMVGTIRTFDPAMREEIHKRIKQTATKIAESAGASADIEIPENGYPVTYNDPVLTAQMAPTLQRVAGTNNVKIVPARTTAEDFSFYQERIPGLFFFLGVTPRDADFTKVASNHSPLFYVDESALIVGIRAMSYLALDYLYMHRSGNP